MVGGIFWCISCLLLHYFQRTEAPPCSRPLGIRFDTPRNRLVVADAYLGVCEVLQESGEVRRIFPFPDDSDFKVTFFNDLDVLPDGRIVVSEVSTKYPLHEIAKAAMESRPHGR